MREYFADVERTWEELTLFANDFRAIPGAVVVMGHVEGRLDGEPIRRGAVWTWKVRPGRRPRCASPTSAPRLDSARA